MRSPDVWVGALVSERVKPLMPGRFELRKQFSVYLLSVIRNFQNPNPLSICDRVLFKELFCGVVAEARATHATTKSEFF